MPISPTDKDEATAIEATDRMNAIIRLKVESDAAREEIMQKRFLMQPMLDGGPTCP